jgi:uncharacterized protein YdiU (UPF0061 family)
LKASHSRLRLLDGSHPFKQAVPGAYVDYAVRQRPGGRVFLFNFELARDIGLLPRDHPDTLDRRLVHDLLDCFGLEIVNEYDQLHGLGPTDADDGRRYMATRYLQLQHPDRRGLSSGDGRSIWNGCIRGEHRVWDVSSCGTGATRLSPATATTKQFYRTGDKGVAYGCGRSDLWEGICAALMSEVLHYNDVRTERTLAIIRYPDGSAITVRTYPNLLRPAHLFYHLKQADLEGLRRAVDYYIERQIENGDWPRAGEPRARYARLLECVTEDFARAAAQFESEYIFCWMDWDGDNILMDGGIIDYGSVRQFGLFHHEYRYDDVDRLSTKLTEQKSRARYIVQTFAQLVDYVASGRKKNLKQFRRDPALGQFDRRFEAWMDRLLVYKIGFDAALHDELLRDARFARQLAGFRRLYAGFERVKSRRGLHKVSDGVTHDAIFCLRDALRQLPARYLEGERCLPPEQFVELMRSSYTSQRDLRLSASRKANILAFQANYWQMIERAAVIARQPASDILGEVARRSALINRRERITGDGILVAARRLLRDANLVNHKELYGVFRDFVRDQVLRPERRVERPPAGPRSRPSRLLYGSLHDIIREYREGL